MRHFFLLVCLLTFWSAFARVAHATAYTWTGATSNVWNLASNWTPSTGFPNAAADTATFPATLPTRTTATITTTSISVGAITFANNGYTISSSATNVGFNTIGAITTPTTTGTNTISAPITLTLSPTWTVGSTTAASSNILAVTGTINYGNFQVQKSGLGTLIVNGINTGTGVTATIGSGTTYSATFRLNAGFVQVGNSSAFGSGTVDIRAATLQSSTPVTFANIFNNAISASTFGGTNALTFSGPYIISNGGTGQAINVTNTAPTTFSGNVSLSDSTTISKALLPVSVAGTAGLTTISGVIQNSTSGVAGLAGALTKSGTGELKLSGANTYTGATTISAGKLTLGTGGNIPDASNMTLAGGTLNLNDFSEAAGTLSVTANSTIDFGPGTNANTLTYSGAGTFAVGPTLTVTNYSLGTDHLFVGTTATTLSSTQLTQINFVLANGAGTTDAQQLSTGEVVPILPTVIYWTGDRGDGQWNSMSGDGTDTNWSSDATGSSDLGRLPRPQDDVIFAANNATSLTTTLGQDFTIRSLTFTTASPVTISGNILTIGSFSTGTTVASSAGPVIISSNLVGSMPLTKENDATLVLSGANTYTGTTTINKGLLTASGGSAIADTGAVVLANASGATFELATNETIGSLAGGGTTGGGVTLGANTLTTGGTNTSTTFAGIISGTGSLVKAGTGTLTLSGANNYTGGTTISTGTLSVGGNTTVGTILGDVVNNGTLTFSRVDNYTFPGIISGTGAVTRVATGTGAGDAAVGANATALTLSGVNTFTGNITSTNGGFRATNSSSLGIGPKTITLVNGTAGNPNLRLNGSTGDITLPANFTYSTSNSSIGASTILNEAGNNTILGAISMNSGGGSTIVQSDAGTLVIAASVTAVQTGRILILQGASGGTVTGVISDGTGTNTVAITKNGTGTWTLSGTNTYTLATTVSAGTLTLGASDRIANTSPMVLSGGSFSTGGFNETVSTLTLTENSSIDFGTGSSTLTYAASNAITWTAGKTLSITNYTSGSDHLFVGTTATGLTASQLAQIKFNLGALVVSATQLSTGEVVPNLSVLISELRFSGPGGDLDEFIELVNPSASPIDLSGWTLTAGTTTTALSGIDFTGKTIPAKGHLLLTNSGGYSLSSVASGDVTYTGDIAPASTLTLSNAASTVVDTVGNLSAIAAPSSASNQYAYVRRLDSGIAADSGSDSADFNLVDTSATVSTTDITGVGPMTAARLGAPGPQNIASPIQRNNQVELTPLTIGTAVQPTARYVSRGSTIDTKGRMGLRRTLKNNTGATVNTLRFRIVGGTTGTSTTASGVADLRAISSAGVRYYGSDGTTILQATVPVTLDAPSSPTEAPLTATSGNNGKGGGMNSSWTVALPSGGLAPGASVGVEFLFGILADGNYRIVLDSELLP